MPDDPFDTMQRLIDSIAATMTMKPDDPLDTYGQALMATFKKTSEASLATVREVKAAAHRDGLLYAYRVAATEEVIEGDGWPPPSGLPPGEVPQQDLDALRVTAQTRGLGQLFAGTRRRWPDGISWSAFEGLKRNLKWRIAKAPPAPDPQSALPAEAAD